MNFGGAGREREEAGEIHLTLFFAVVLLAMGAEVAAQQPQPCAAPEHRQFDFWVGDWRVTTPDGKHAGDNRIEKVLDGCALHESWQGAGGGRGFSYNAYDRDRKVWHQTWVDRQGNLLLLEGGLRDGAMVLEGAQGATLNRITWTSNKDGSVRQHWEASADQGKTWQTAFDGLYRRKTT
jgi:hypothetical protein